MKCPIYKIFIVACFCLLSHLDASAQVVRSGAVHVDSHSQLVKNYTDSLAIYRHRIDSLAEENRRLKLSSEAPLLDGKYYKLFVPLTFYHSLAKNKFSLGSDSSMQSIENKYIENALMNIYLKRQDLVANSENNLQKAGGATPEIDVPVHHDAGLVEKISPTTIEPTKTPVEVLVKRPNFWTIKGDYYLQFLQNYVSSNWYKGGESTYSMLGSITMEANYNNKQKVKWDNKLEMKLGFLTSRSDSLHSFKTSEDLIRYTGKLGLQASKKWYYTLQVLASTQFYRGYKSNDERIYSDFLSPFDLNISLGMDYTVEAFNKKLTGNVHLAPAAYNFRFVKRKELATRYNLEEGKKTLHDIGSQFTIDLMWKFTDQINWKMRIYGFTTYKRAEFEWENTFVFKFNRYISTNVFIYPRFDDGVARDGHHGYWQLKEFASVGFAYSF